MERADPSKTWTIKKKQEKFEKYFEMWLWNSIERELIGPKKKETRMY